MLAKSVTAFQVAIAMSAISVLAKRKALWYLGLVPRRHRHRPLRESLL